jgi:hypothetical protein
MSKDVVLSLVRHALTFGGGYLVSKGIIDQEQLIEGIGAISSIIAITWSVRLKIKK